MRKNRHVIKSDTETTPQGAEFRGEYIQWGHLNRRVFVEKVEKSKLVPRTDPLTGGQLYKRGAGGVVLNSVHTTREVTGSEEREFVLDDLGNGMVTKCYNFRPDPEEVKRAERDARRKANLEALLDAAEEAGGIDELLNGADDDEPKRKRGKKAA